MFKKGKKVGRCYLSPVTAKVKDSPGDSLLHNFRISCNVKKPCESNWVTKYEREMGYKNKGKAEANKLGMKP